MLTVFLLPLFGPVAQAQLTDGIYAVFDTTLGSFTSKIHYAEAPMAAANFIGLAEGSLPWIDLPSGRVTQGPFYDGITFHRVIDGFVIQGGSPNGQGTDGPGYTFIDQFDTNLLHSTAGILSMANSGLHSNGSQFFITLGPTPHLDGKHIVFGEVIDGLSIVQAIGSVATDGNDKPLTDVVMNRIVIERKGTNALAFNVTSNQLPVVTATASSLTGHSSTNLMLSLPANTNTEVFISSSTNLIDWTLDAKGFSSATGTLTLPYSSNNDREYSTTAQVAYPHIARLDHTPSSWTLDLSGSNFTNNALTVTINSNDTTRSYTSDFSNYASGTLSNLVYSASRPYKLLFRPTLNPETGSQPLYLELDLHFTTSTNGVLEGFYVPNFPSGAGFQPVTGSFELTIP